MKAALLLFILTCAPNRLWGTAEVALPGGSGYGTGLTGPFNLGTNLIGTSSTELSCLLSKADPKVKREDAEETAEGLEKALKEIKFAAGEMTRTGLLHFLSQTLAETGYLKSVEQKGAPSEAKKGYGLIQVTGYDNLRECGRCMDECSPATGKKMLANKPGVIGDKAPDRTAAALVSLCWWRKNVIQNRKHGAIANEKSTDASRKVTQIVNAGGVGRRVTDGEKNLSKREKFFTQLASVDSGGSCRKN